MKKISLKERKKPTVDGKAGQKKSNIFSSIVDKLVGFFRKAVLLKGASKYKERASVKVKLIISFVLLSVVPIVLISAGLFINVKSTISNKLIGTNSTLLDKSVENIDMKIYELENSLNLFAVNKDVLKIIESTLDDYKSMYEMTQEKETKVISLMQTILNSKESVSDIYIFKENEVISAYSYPKYIKKKNKETFLKEFFKGDIWEEVSSNSGQTVWYKELYDTENIFLIKQLDLSKEQGVIIMEIKPEFILSSIEHLAFESQENMLVNSNGMVMFSTIEDSMDSSYSFYPTIESDLASLQKGEVGNSINSDTDKGDQFVYYKPCFNGWVYVMTIPSKMIFNDIDNLQNFVSVLVSIAVILSVAIALYIAINIAKPIRHMKDSMKKVETGDFTARTTLIGQNEMGKLSSSFNRMTENISELIKEVQHVSDDINEDANKVNTFANASMLASKEIMHAVSSITEGATEQAKEAENTTEVVKQLTSNLRETETHFKEVVEATNTTKEVSSGATLTMNNLNQTTKDAMNLSNFILKDMGSLINEFNNIVRIVESIDGISEQTNLLALNASIEAARVGESGKGFKVVADEVRKLAVMSKESVKSISSIIESITLETKETENVLIQGTEIYEKQENVVKKTQGIFNAIMSNMDSIVVEVNLVYQLLDGMEDIEREAIDSITSIAAIAQQSAAAMEEVLASSENQIGTAEELVDMSKQLENMIKDMGVRIREFNV